MDGFVFRIEWWHWAVLGMVFAIIEVFVPGGFLIGMGVAALIVCGAVAYAPGVAWEYQALGFAALSFVSVFAMRRWFVSTPIASDHPELNRRAAQYVGRRFTLAEPIVNGVGTIRVDDSTWRVRGEDCPVGAVVRITGCDGTVLEAERVEEPA